MRSRSDRPSVGYSQHEGAEQATWGDDKLQLVDGTHPVVYPAAGSHANFYDDGLFLGSSAEQGVGCDNTTGPHDDLRPAVATIPSDPAQARAEFPWIDFQGRWGELQPAFFNGPTGPNLKTQWTRADHVVGGLARPELHRPGRQRVRDGGDRLLLPGDRQRVEGARAARPPPAAVHAGRSRCWRCCSSSPSREPPGARPRRFAWRAGARGARRSRRRRACTSRNRG